MDDGAALRWPANVRRERLITRPDAAAPSRADVSVGKQGDALGRALRGECGERQTYAGWRRRLRRYRTRRHPIQKRHSQGRLEAGIRLPLDHRPQISLLTAYHHVHVAAADGHTGWQRRGNVCGPDRRETVGDKTARASDHDDPCRAGRSCREQTRDGEAQEHDQAEHDHHARPRSQDGVAGNGGPQRGDAVAPNQRGHCRIDDRAGEQYSSGQTFEASFATPQCRPAAELFARHPVSTNMQNRLSNTCSSACSPRRSVFECWLRDARDNHQYREHTNASIQNLCAHRR